MFVFSNNVVKYIGSTVEGFMGNDSNPALSDGYTKHLFEHKQFADFINYQINRNDINITDAFISCKILEKNNFSEKNFQHKIYVYFDG